MTGPRIPNLFAVPELKEKLLFTLMCLAIYRLGAHIATPGVDVQVLACFFVNLYFTVIASMEFLDQKKFSQETRFQLIQDLLGIG